MSQNVVVLKISWKDDTRRFRVPVETTFQQLRDDVAQKFGLAEFRLKYIDEENELITVASDRELREAIDYLREQGPGRIIRFFVRTPDDISTDVTQSMMNMSLYDNSRINSFGTPPGTYSHLGHPNMNPQSYPSPNVNSGVPYGSGNQGPSASSYLLPGQHQQQHQHQHQHQQQQHQQEPHFHGGQTGAPAHNVDHFRQPPSPYPAPVELQPNPVEPKPRLEQVKAPMQGLGSETKYNSRFVRDKEMPDGTVVAPGQKCTKIWLMKNTGSATWPRDCVLEWQSGDKFECTHRVNVPEASVGEEVDVRMEFIAPINPGNYAGHYRMVLPNGVSFGNRVWVDFRVAGA